MDWLIVWAPLLEFVVGCIATFFFAEKFKEVATMIIVQFILYMVLINALLLYGFSIKH
jgi:uncharacterized membrane protein YoaK (UPF0700 family)